MFLRAQIEAAVRSVETNLWLGAFFIISMTCLALLPSTWRPYGYVLLFSTMKTAMPILTTVANFGNVKSVIAKYWNNFLYNVTA